MCNRIELQNGQLDEMEDQSHPGKSYDLPETVPIARPTSSASTEEEMEDEPSSLDLDKAATMAASLTLDNIFVAKFMKCKMPYLVFEHKAEHYYVDKDGNVYLPAKF